MEKKKLKIWHEIGKRIAYLQNTDYIVIKIFEAKIKGNENKVELLQQLYKSQLEEREKKREEINSLEKELKSL